jgi:XTP/dITP diphosphohydrolase
LTLYCATTNPGKLREFRLAAEHFGHGKFQVATAEGLATLEPPEENGDTFEANAAMKAVYYSRHAPGLLFADDSGIEALALDGAPGVYSARFAGPNASDEDNNRLLLEKLKGVKPRAGRFVCVVALAEAGKLVRTFRGVVDGRILEKPRGANGFGYDPLFYYAPFSCTFAEISGERKLLVSHRGRALQEMFGWLEQ